MGLKELSGTGRACLARSGVGGAEGKGASAARGYPRPVSGYLGDCRLAWRALTHWTAINAISAPVSLGGLIY